MPFPAPGDLPDPGVELGSSALQADALPSEPPRKKELVRHQEKLLDTVSQGLVGPGLLKVSALLCPAQTGSVLGWLCRAEVREWLTSRAPGECP